MAQAILLLEQMDTGATFYHQADGRALFEWLQRVPCVASLSGDGRHGLVVRLKRRPGNDDLRQLIALCQRYGVDLQQLAKFQTDHNRVWFRDPGAFWHRAIFHPGSGVDEDRDLGSAGEPPI